MPIDRKRSFTRDASTTPHASFTTASANANAGAFARHTYTNRSATLPPPPRPSSPPASAYYAQYAQDDLHELQPTGGDPSSHFAYSTTLRRHHVEGPLGTPQTPGQTFQEFRNVVIEEGPSGLWDRLVSTIRRLFKSEASEYERLPTQREQHKDTPSARFAHCSVEVRKPLSKSISVSLITMRINQDTLAYFHTSPSHGLSPETVSTLLQTNGYNEFSVSAPEPVLLKFAKTIYESPLILLLCGSALVSALMGNIDDAVSITVAVLIVLTGRFSMDKHLCSCSFAVVGFIQEQRSEKSLEALNKLVPHHCHVIRYAHHLSTVVRWANAP